MSVNSPNTMYRREPLYSNGDTCQTSSVFHVVRATSAKFDLHAGNVKFNTQNGECIRSYEHLKHNQRLHTFNKTSCIWVWKPVSVSQIMTPERERGLNIKNKSDSLESPLVSTAVIDGRQAVGLLVLCTRRGLKSSLRVHADCIRFLSN
jgi:hypothetical protein